MTHHHDQRRRVIVGVTGASGAVYARRLISCLFEASVDVHVVVSPNGRRLFLEELSISEMSATTLVGQETDQVMIHPYRDVGSILGSGSFHTDGMVVCPCSSNTLASMAMGLSKDLLGRAAAVTMKEMRRLIVVPREMPTSRIDLENSLRLSQAGAIICPASPGFYMNPKTIEDLVDFVVGKLLDLLDIDHDLKTRWAGSFQSSNQEVPPKTP